MSCRIALAEVNGWQALTLANSAIEVTVLPQKGADIYSFVDVTSGIDVLMKTPAGLLPPNSPPRPGSDEGVFLHNYEGAWQELFPNTGPSCSYDGHEIPLHGEVATLPWACSVERQDADAIEVHLKVLCRELPLSLIRRMSLRASAPVLILEETVTNLSDRTVSFVWGHHPVVGAPFLEAGCEIRVGNCIAHTPDPPFDPSTSSYAAGQRAPWPYIRGIDGREVDLRRIPGRDANIHDHAFLAELSRGFVEVENPRLGLAFSLEWDPKIFRWINNWRPLGGSHTPPLEGIYGLALEPWVWRGNLADAIATGAALSLGPRGTLSTSLSASLRNTRGSATYSIL